MSVYMSVLP